MSARGASRGGRSGRGGASGSAASGGMELSGVSGSGSSGADASGGVSASVLSDVTRDEIQCLFRCHDDIIELVYQVSIPAVFDIFRAMLKEVAKVSDSPEALAATFEDSLSNVSQWNRMTVREITRAWSKLGKQLIMLVRKCAKVKALILKKNELVESADVNVNLEFCSILHSILVFSSSALIEEMPALLKSKGSQACMEIMLRRHQVVEKAVVHLVRDGLNDLLLDEPVRSTASGTFPTRFAGASAPDASASYVGPLRYSVPQIQQAICDKPMENGHEVKFDFDMLNQNQQDESEPPDGLGAEDQDFPSDDDDENEADEADEAQVSQEGVSVSEDQVVSESVDVPEHSESESAHGGAQSGTLNLSNARVPVTISRDVARVLLRDM